MKAAKLSWLPSYGTGVLIQISLVSGMSGSGFGCFSTGLFSWGSGTGTSGVGDCGSACGWLSLLILLEVGGRVLINRLLGLRGLSSSSV